MKKELFTVFSLAALACVAAPTIDGVTMSQDADTRIVSINYRLTGEEPAIITLSLETNVTGDVWAPVDDARVTALAGPVNRVVQPSEDVRTVMWSPERDWSGVTIDSGMIRPVVTAWPTGAPPVWASVDLTGKDALRFYATTNAIPGGLAGALHKDSRMLMRRIEAAGIEWAMGAPTFENGTYETRNDVGKGNWGWCRDTLHRVTLTRDYWMAVFPTTQAQWATVTGTRPSSQKTCEHNDVDWHPVEKVSYGNVATETHCFLNMIRSGTGNATFNLPTIAEWEYACRAGTTGGLYTGEELEYADGQYSERLAKLAWYGGNSGGRTHAVGQKQPNAWGLYDMLGNVDEMSRDWFVQSMGSEDKIDPTYPNQTGDKYYHATGGGNFGRESDRCRPCCRNGYDNGATAAGFRVMCYSIW